jgi:hypothetical protein
MTTTWHRTTKPVHAALADGNGGTVPGTGRTLAAGTHVKVTDLGDGTCEVRSITGYVATVNRRIVKEA